MAIEPRRWRSRAANAALLAAGTIVAVALAELTFRFVVPAGDHPAVAFENGIAKYRPLQTGVYRVGNEIAARFAINASGWNSGHAAYRRDRVPGRARIAIVGDSFVEALQVPHDRSLAEQLEQRLGADRTEVYRFGISAAPLSQYLWIIEREVLAYRPDLVVAVLIHNDFDESYRFIGGRYHSAFLKVRLDPEAVVELPPQGFELPWTSRLVLSSATLRFFRYRQQLDAGGLARRWTGPAAGPAPAGGPIADGYIGAEALTAALPEILRATDYLIGRITTVVRARGGEVLFVIDGARASLYRGADAPVLELNRQVAALARNHRAPLVDLDPVFAGDWQRHHRRFDFDRDAHWNEYGHQLAAAAIADEVRRRK
jgi:hypothetical protein